MGNLAFLFVFSVMLLCFSLPPSPQAHDTRTHCIDSVFVIIVIINYLFLNWRKFVEPVRVKLYLSVEGRLPSGKTGFHLYNA